MAPIRFRQAIIVLALAAVLVLGAALPVDACPTCKAGLENESHDGLQQGYFWSILLMMSMPFIILLGLATLFYLSIRRARRQAISLCVIEPS